MAIPQTVCKSDVYKLLSTNCSRFVHTISCPCREFLQVLLPWLACLQLLGYTPVLQPSADTHWWEAQSTWWVADPRPWQAQQAPSNCCSLSVHGSRQTLHADALQEVLQLMHTCCLQPPTASMQDSSKFAEPPHACCSCAPPAADGPATSQHCSPATGWLIATAHYPSKLACCLAALCQLTCCSAACPCAPHPASGPADRHCCFERSDWLTDCPLPAASGPGCAPLPPAERRAGASDSWVRGELQPEPPSKSRSTRGLQQGCHPGNWRLSMCNVID